MAAGDLASAGCGHAITAAQGGTQKLSRHPSTRAFTQAVTWTVPAAAGMGKLRHNKRARRAAAIQLRDAVASSIVIISSPRRLRRNV